LESLKIDEERKDELGIAKSLNNIGAIYNNLEAYDQAIEYYKRALAIKEKLGVKTDMAATLNNIGRIYYHKNNFELAKSTLLNSLQIRIEIDDKGGIASSYTSLGGMYKEQKNYLQALQNFGNALAIYKETGDHKGIAELLCEMGEMHFKLKNYSKAIDFLNHAHKIADENYFLPEIVFANMNLYKAYKALGSFESAMSAFEIYREAQDSIMKEDRLAEMERLQTNYAIDKKQKELELAEKNLELEAKTSENLKLFSYSLSVVALLIIVLAINSYRNNQRTKRLNAVLSEQKGEITLKNSELHQVNEELLATMELIEKQSKEIAHKNTNITASIQYANRIQNAVMPQIDQLEEFFSDQFVFFRPRDIVSGDFYWFKSFENKVYIAVADCTGHGVPGAFMSILGITLLNEIVRPEADLHPNMILNNLRLRIKSALKQPGKDGEQKDGIDISIICFDKTTKQLDFAGAYQSMLILSKSNTDVENYEIQSFKGDRMPVGIYLSTESDFTPYSVTVKENDVIYLYTDGYADQIKDETKRKFLLKNFKTLIQGIAGKELHNQCADLEQNFDQWRNTAPQVDDVLVIGLKI